MKQIPKSKKLVLNNLFWRTCRVTKIHPVIIKGWPKEAFNSGHMFGTGETTIESEPSYQLHHKNFEIFIKGLELIGSQSEAASECVSVENVKRCKNDNEVGKLFRERDRVIEKCSKDYLKFITRYQNAFEAMVLHYNDKEYFNLELFPRDGGKTKKSHEKSGGSLFRRFLNAYLRVQGIRRVSAAGAPRKTCAYSVEEQHLIETNTRRGKSRSLTAGEIAEKRGYSLEKEGKKLPSLKQSIKRHIRRKHQSHQ